MDRNPIVPVELTTLVNVALRKESVDRNIASSQLPAAKPVALRKESVDRNIICLSFLGKVLVALRKESVDRNDRFHVADHLVTRRSPQGERG